MIGAVGNDNDMTIIIILVVRCKQCIQSWWDIRLSLNSLAAVGGQSSGDAKIW